MITPAQCRAARALLEWRQQDLARETKISAVTIAKFEKRRVRLKDSTALLFRLAFERAGIDFIDPDGGGPGVRLRELRE